MHKGSILASMLISLLLIAIVVFQVMGLLIVSSYSFTLRHPRTHAQVVCRASFAPGVVHGWSPEEVATICTMACGSRGFELTGRRPNLVIDFFSQGGLQFEAERYRQFIPRACLG